MAWSACNRGCKLSVDGVLRRNSCCNLSARSFLQKESCVWCFWGKRGVEPHPCPARRPSQPAGLERESVCRFLPRCFRRKTRVLRFPQGGLLLAVRVERKTDCSKISQISRNYTAHLFIFVQPAWAACAAIFSCRSMALSTGGLLWYSITMALAPSAYQGHPNPSSPHPVCFKRRKGKGNIPQYSLVQEQRPGPSLVPPAYEGIGGVLGC